MSESGLYENVGQRANQSPLEQRESLLKTKLFIPSVRLKQVDRPRLFEQLNQGLDKALILISAPAGYGKTTLVSSWLRATNVPSAWVSLDEDDNDPLHFLQYLLTALQRIIPAVGTDLLSGPQPVRFETLINLLINEIAEYMNPVILVLDDFQLIRAQPILEMVSLFLERVPPNMHLALLSRTDPPIPLSRLRSRNQLEDIRADHLRFTLDEVTVFLNEIMGLKLAPEDVASLETRTEGWIASLQLAALSMQGTKDIHGFVRAFAGSHHYIMDYLAEEVLRFQPEPVRLFLLKTSILKSMTGSLCNAILELDEAGPFNGQTILESLEQMNLFVIPLDEDKRWYRYHHLFAEVLNRHLEKQFPHQLHDLHRQASQWYAQNGFIPEAIHHALAGNDKDFAVQLIEQNGCLLLIRGELSTLPNWIKAVEPHTQTRPWMYIFKAWLAVLTGYPEQVEETLQKAEKLISSEPVMEVRTMLGTIATARAYQANLQGETSPAARFARQALEYLPDIDLVSRSLRTVATSLLGDASSMNGDLEEARRAYMEARQIGQAAGDVHLVIVANSNLANILIEQGFLHQAAKIYSETLEMTTRPDGQKSVLAGRVYAELSQVSYESNNLEIAMLQVHQCIALCRQWGNMDLQAVGFAMLARLEHVQRHSEKTLEAIHIAERISNEYHLLPRYSLWVKYALARLWIGQGNPEKVSRLVEERGITIHDEIPYLRELEYLILLRLLLARGDYDAAHVLSQRLLSQAEAAHRTGRVIEVLVLQALILQGKQDLNQALIALKRALSLAQPEGYIRTFLDEGEPMLKLLYLAKSRRIGAGYAEQLLSEIGEVPGRTNALPQPLNEPLTMRELEVLKLIEDGCSNQEIAGKLVISITTVKRHISNVYAKLGAKSRTQAISLGKELKLFG